MPVPQPVSGLEPVSDPPWCRRWNRQRRKSKQDMRDNLIAKGREDVRRALDEQAKHQPPAPNAFVVLAVLS